MMIGLARFRPLSVLMMALFFLGEPHLFAAGPPSRGRVITVCPVADGDTDEGSTQFAREVALSLRENSRHHVIDSGLTADVVSYYDDKEVISSTVLEAEKSLSAAKEHYFQFRYADARRELGRVVSMLAAGGEDMDAVGKVLVDAYVTNAFIARASGDPETARDSFARALRINPRLDLSTEEYPPSVTELFAAERAKVLASPSGSLEVVTKPAAVDVHLNGIRQGPTPLRLDLPEGSYQLSVTANKYKGVSQTVKIRGGRRVVVRETLKWQQGPVEADQLPEDAAAHVREGQRIAGVMKADKAVLIDADTIGHGGKITARMVDRKFGVGQRPIELYLDDFSKTDEGDLAELSEFLSAQADAEIKLGEIDPAGMADPVLLGKRKRRFSHSPYLWGALGLCAAGAVAGGIVAAMSGGGAAGRGDLRVQFR